MQHRIGINMPLYEEGCINMFHHIEKFIGKSYYSHTRTRQQTAEFAYIPLKDSNGITRTCLKIL